MPSQWPAVGAETDPLRRARQLQKGWERLLADGALGPELPPGATAGLRPTIVDSWQRSLATGLDPTDLLAPIEADESEVLDRWLEHPLGSLTHLLTEQLKKVAEESQSVVVVTDASGLVLHRVGEEWLKERAHAEMNLVEGARYSEAADGTNAIGTALAADHVFQVFAFEHFNERHHEWICSGAPVHDPVSGQTIGLIDLSSLWKNAHPRTLELVATAARTIEQHLLYARRDRDARLLRRYGDLASRSTDLLVNGDGYMLTGDESTHPTPLDVPEGGGEIVLDAESVAVAEPLGQGEAYLVRRLPARGARAAPVQALERAEERAREVASEQAALHHVATLVARESSPGRLFAVVAEQVAQVFDVPLVRLVRYEPDGLAVIGAFSEGDDEPFPVGSRWPLDTPGVAAIVRETGRPARVENYAQMSGQIAGVVREAGMRSAVGSPIVVEGRLWGAMLVLSPRREPLPEDTETRLTDFTELVATAIANAESREALAQLAEEQAALRRVATLVAENVPSGELFAAVAQEAGTLLGADYGGLIRYEDDATVTALASWAATGELPPIPDRFRTEPGDPTTMVAETRQPARVDDWTVVPGPLAAFLRDELAVRSGVGSPIVVEGRLWGVLGVHSKGHVPLPPDTESRLGQFTELVATAIANREARTEVARLANEQAALRRVATLVARDAPPGEVFDAVAMEVGKLLDTDITVVGRYDGDGAATAIGSWSASPGGVPVGTRSVIGGRNVMTLVAETEKPARLDEYDDASGEAAEIARRHDWRSSIAAPIIVEGRLWGVMLVATQRPEAFPADAEYRLSAFTELVATAIANAQAHDEVRRFGEEQAALGRVATLVAAGAAPEQVFTAVVGEASSLVGLERIELVRYDGDNHGVVMAASGEHPFPPGSTWSLDDPSVMATVARTARAARIDDYSALEGEIAREARSAGFQSALGAPVTVEGRLWGVIIAISTEPEPISERSEARLCQFTELVATAVANAESRDVLARLADEQAALRRVATLVAQGAAADELFAAVTKEFAGLFPGVPAFMPTIIRFDPGPEFVLVGASELEIEPPPAGSRWGPTEIYASTRVLKTGRSAYVDATEVESQSGPDAEYLRRLGFLYQAGSPIVVEGRLWGALTINSGLPLPPDTGQRLERFTELIATAIANAESREARAVLTEEQAALQHVATLVAQGASPQDLFEAVAEEVGRLLPVESATMGRFEPDDSVIAVASWSTTEALAFPTGMRWPTEGTNIAWIVRQTGRTARIDDFSGATDPIGVTVREAGIKSAVGSPIVVNGHVWGLITAASTETPMLPDTEARLASFTELVATAIANAESWSELAASRARVVAASAEERRRVVRDLHDGAQQRLVHSVINMKLALRELARSDEHAEEHMREALDHAEQANLELRELVYGILPGALTSGGLRAGVEALASRSTLPVTFDVPAARFPTTTEATAYFVVSEALTNAVKHSQAHSAEVAAHLDNGALLVEVRDDGVGGADPSRGSGLTGLRDRVEALGGTIEISSPAGNGTSVTARLPAE